VVSESWQIGQKVQQAISGGAKRKYPSEDIAYRSRTLSGVKSIWDYVWLEIAVSLRDSVEQNLESRLLHTGFPLEKIFPIGNWKKENSHTFSVESIWDYAWLEISVSLPGSVEHNLESRLLHTGFPLVKNFSN
jgi:hypothetical protein